MPLNVCCRRAGIATAWYFYLVNPAIPARLQQTFKGIYTVLENKYYLDRFNEWFFAGGARRLGILADAWNASSAKGSEASSLASRLDKGRRLPSGRELIKATNDVAHVLPTDMVNSLPNGDPERFIELVHQPLVHLIRSPSKIFKESNGNKFNYHQVDVEIVPEDRLPQDVDMRPCVKG